MGGCHGKATLEGSVDGHAGTLEIQNQSRVNGDLVEAAHFTILSGTDELTTLHGHGSFTGRFSDNTARTTTVRKEVMSNGLRSLKCSIQ